MNLTPAMIKAIKGARDDGTIQDAGRNTERALIRRGLADEVRGTVNRRNRTSHFAQTVYDAYLGARLNDEGHKVRAELLVEGK
jgi:hypothetical protein